MADKEENKAKPTSNRQKKLKAAREARAAGLAGPAPVEAPAAAGPSSNWEMLKKKLPADTRRAPSSKKRRTMGGVAAYAREEKVEKVEKVESASAGPSKKEIENVEVVVLPPPNDSPLVQELRQMVIGNQVLSEAKKAPGNYVAIDCEMVGLGHMGSESMLARVSLVNYHGHVLLDTFVQPRERVTDYRTWVSGIRESDLRGAPSFDVVQKQVAELVEGRVLIGHAIDNDTKALLLSHPAPYVRDTQKCKQLREVAKTKRPGLKNLVQLELGLKIQGGSHSSITDARATMALYRLHKVAWEASLRGVMEAFAKKTGKPMPGKKAKGKRKREGEGEGDEEDGEEGDGEGKNGRKEFPGGGRKGISSGLSVVVKRFGKKVESDQPRRRGPAPAASSSSGNWWEEAAA